MSPSTVRRYEREGRLPATVTVGGQRRYDRDGVERRARGPAEPDRSDMEMDQAFAPVPAPRRHLRGRLGARHQRAGVPTLAPRGG